MSFSWKNAYASYLNLDHRSDRLIHMKNELDRVGLNATRTKGQLPTHYDLNDPKVQVMKNRTPGAIGCYMGQLEIMKEAFQQGRSAWVMEDDLVFCSDIKSRLDYIENFLNLQDSWDVLWLGGTVHINPSWWHTGSNRDLPGSNIGRDAERTEDARMLRTYGAFSTHCYIVNKNSIERVMQLLNDVMIESMGIDWSFIKLGAKLKCFMFLPGCVKQMDNMSDIGHGITKFSGFSMLGPYWWQDRVDQFNPDGFNFGEAQIGH